MGTLLGQFYSRIKGSQEDIASEALVYILQNSKVSRLALEKLIQEACTFEHENLRYLTQGVGENLERPDILGRNDSGIEPLLIEAKFWASLTINQPNTYLRRLPEQGVLMFLVPQERKTTIYSEQIDRISEEYEVETIEDENFRIELATSRKQVIVRSWHEVLDRVKLALVDDHDHNAISDLEQLQGYCEVVTQQSFLPLNDEDLAPIIPRRLLGYFGIVDDTVEELKRRDKDFSTKGLVRTPSRNGYNRYFSYKSLGLALSVRYDYWSAHGDTPFWLTVKEMVNNEKNWRQTNKVLEALNHLSRTPRVRSTYINDELVLGLYPLLNRQEDEIKMDLMIKVWDLVNAVIDNIDWKEHSS